MLTNQARYIRTNPDLLRQALRRWRRIRDTTGEGLATRDTGMMTQPIFQMRYACTYRFGRFWNSFCH
jgi:hypothetical protein